MSNLRKPTRGERNRNPGNIAWNDKVTWRGQIPDYERTDARFCQFDDDASGLRALCRVLLNYQRLDGCKTLADVVARYAPSIENDTAAYLADVVARTGIAADCPLDLEKPSELATIARAIICHENDARCIYSTALLTQAAQMALA
jgi:hypothetical protein